MRIMTADTVAFYWLVYKIVCSQLIFHDDMTRKTKLRLLDNQQAWMVGAMRRVTDSTFADGRRSMQKRKSFGNFMAVFAKSGDRFLRNQEFVITAVRVMALHAITCFQRFVNNLLGSLL